MKELCGNPRANTGRKSCWQPRSGGPVLFALEQPPHMQIAQLFVLPVNRW